MNAHEFKVKKWLEKKGFKVVRNGFPDFLVLDEKKNVACLVEVKNAKDKLSPAQVDMHYWLKMMGIPVYVVRDRSDLDIKGRKMFTTKIVDQYKASIRETQQQIEFAKNELERRFVQQEEVLEEMTKAIEACSVVLDESGNERFLDSDQSIWKFTNAPMYSLIPESDHFWEKKMTKREFNYQKVWGENYG